MERDLMKELIESLQQNGKVIIKDKEYKVKSKVWYTLEEDNTASYVKCQLSDNKILVIIPEDKLIYVGNIIPDMVYERLEENKVKYEGELFDKTGEGHQFIVQIVFGNQEEVEGKCIFEDYESEHHIISLGLLDNKERADVYAEIIDISEIQF